MNDESRPVKAAPVSTGVPARTGVESSAPAGDAGRRRDRIKLLLSAMTTTTEKIAELLEAAQADGDHRALGYASWTAYVAGEYAESLAGLSAAARRPAVAALAEGGLSTRAIAEIAGVGQSTVGRDLQVTRSGSPGEARVIGVDGKSYAADRPVAVPHGGLLRTDDHEVPTEAEIGEMFAQRIEAAFGDDPETWAAPHDMVKVIRVLWPWPTHPQHVALRTVAYEMFTRCPVSSPVWDVMNIWLYHVAGVALREYEDIVARFPAGEHWPGKELARLVRVVCNPDLDLEMQLMLRQQLEVKLVFAVLDTECWLHSDQIERCRDAVGMERRQPVAGGVR